jgi:hypothetical protein
MFPSRRTVPEQAFVQIPDNRVTQNSLSLCRKTPAAQRSDITHLPIPLL